MSRTPVGDVIVLLPGIMGSVLQKDGKDVWALSGGAPSGRSQPRLQHQGPQAPRRRSRSR